MLPKVAEMSGNKNEALRMQNEQQKTKKTEFWSLPGGHKC
jgi:hypothetical protein